MTRYVLTLAPLLSSVALIATLTACEPATPCDEYVDYICDCHADDARPGYDCETLRVTYENADPELQDACVVALDEQQTEDAEDGYACVAGDTGL